MTSGDTTITVIGNLTADPDVRFTPSGAAVASFTVAATRRVFDKDTNAWKDAGTLFMNCSAWRDLAEHVGDTLTKGQRVIAHGSLKQRTYDDSQGIKRTVVELDVEDVGPSLKYATAKVTRATRNGGAPHPADQGGWGSRTPADDPWQRHAAMAGASAGNGASSDEPPF
jgi:single-strand DNA-binding protein